ncbi:bifunctional DNA primase/polymerase domain protein [Mycobacteroides abscessus subsp. bolletii]|uniref:Bifunctional DNA primase/polymerase domain protein n=1 Tax=Mycobacteroides abscessus subsp. bolletii TaxID=319705 RepID=A0A9Q7WH47_9MYCO|nr:bifunctional DNA primase/polymerase [Mycobacteroides abscessus]SHT85304.1 bifunctional DNA primase/polymerase domain protein [Mycobacteroides abscessus subsp. bolletii]SHU09390.1 bifunctional DNA primase/polymerase domain protein [Mycobacteroides abscessus subsp. bolletii]SHW85974.1 bifunctional DNA primase/polymerase domain protein [Mycobacteroides abscessus subsp. bolletii]SIC68546.1 gp54 protein [Mycobacteroides abscessus subsp. abscessus]SKL90876.1 bifunctional DNA primase/polymerase do
MNANHKLIARMAELGCHLMPLAPQIKHPIMEGWPLALATTVDDAIAHVDAKGNLGVNLASSRLIVLDSENLAATQAVVDAGFTLTVITAKSQDPTSHKRGGSHVWLRVPDGIEARGLPSNRLQIPLANGGMIDVLAGARYVVAPPSRIDEAPNWMYAPCQGGPLDLFMPALLDIPVAPSWLFDRSAACPPGLEPLHGILIPDPPRLKVEQDARSIELDNRVDSVPWDQWLASDPRLIALSQLDGCGCRIYHWIGADNDKSATLHDGCEQGYGAHIWSGTMQAALNLDHDHISRLNLAKALHGGTIRERASAVGIELGAEREDLQTVRPSDYLRMAADASATGDTRKAEMYRAAARDLESRLPTAQQRGIAYVVPGTVVGANALVPQTDSPVNEPDPERAGVSRKAGKITIRSFPDREIGDVPVPAEDEFHEYPMPAIPEHITPVQGAKTKMLPVLPPLANRMDHDSVSREWIFSATPGLSHVAAAADSHAVSRWGLLGALLPRIAALVPPTVRLTPASRRIPSDPGPTTEGTSINVYSVLVGPPGSGKTDTMSAAAALIPDVRIVAPGTGEGVLKEFPRGDQDDVDADAAEDYSQPAVGSVGESLSDSVMMESDEMDVFLGELSRQGSRTSGWFRTMWMGGDVGNTASDKDRRSAVKAHTYRFGILLGAQPTTVATLFDESDKGTPQRFMWLTAHQTVQRGPEYPQRLAVAPVYWFGGRPSMIPTLGDARPPVWITPPAAATEYMDADRARAATANPFSANGGYSDGDLVGDKVEAIADRHSVLQQLKISALLAALDGLAQPQDVHWFCAGEVMAVRRRNIEALVALAERLSIMETRKRGQSLGLMQSHAKAASEQETHERSKETSAQVLWEFNEIMREGRVVTRSELCQRIEKNGWGTAAFVPDALALLMSEGIVAQTGDANTYTLLSAGGDAEGATVSVLHPPTIASVGG